jgi:hypothetical protein
MILSKVITVTDESQSLLSLMGIQEGLRGQAYVMLQVDTGNDPVNIGAKGGEVIEVASDLPFSSPTLINLKDLYLIGTASSNPVNVALFYE